MVNWQDIPIYITNFNNLNRGFKLLIDWLTTANHNNIIVIDNASTWKPLLEYYDNSKLNIIRNDKNLGYEAFWIMGLQHNHERFIVTDPDVVPDKNCPTDLVRKMVEIADHFKPIKVGSAIRIDNLPDHYKHKQLMIDSEGHYWGDPVKENGVYRNDCYSAAIDTTFALYDRGWDRMPLHNGRLPIGHIRLNFPYVLEHIPWYDNSNEPNEERDYYKKTVLPNMSHSQ